MTPHYAHYAKRAQEIAHSNLHAASSGQPVAAVVASTPGILAGLPKFFPFLKDLIGKRRHCNGYPIASTPDLPLASLVMLLFCYVVAWVTVMVVDSRHPPTGLGYPPPCSEGSYQVGQVAKDLSLWVATM